MTTLTPQEVLQAIIDGRNLEFRHLGFEEWTRLNPLDNPLSLESIFKDGVLFRLAQEMITIGDVSFPKPITESLDYDETYYVSDLTDPRMYWEFAWSNSSQDYTYLSLGLIHLTKENAIAHAKALIKLSGGNIDE